MQFGLLAVLVLFMIGTFTEQAIYSTNNIFHIGVFLIAWPFVFMLQLIPRLLARKRCRAADEAGLMLCSRCEYPIKPQAEPVPCPECGVVRSAAEHQKVDEDWRFWVK